HVFDAAHVAAAEPGSAVTDGFHTIYGAAGAVQSGRTADQDQLKPRKPRLAVSSGISERRALLPRQERNHQKRHDLSQQWSGSLGLPTADQRRFREDRSARRVEPHRQLL